MFNKINLYKYINNNPISSQRKIATALGLSVGTVNSVIKSGTTENELVVTNISYREKKYSLTVKGMEIINKNGNVNTAVILAAGSNKNLDKPIQLLTFGDKTLLERHIEILKSNNIENIFIIVGDSQPEFRRIYKDYNITIISNKIYKETGNLYSLSLAEKKIKGDFILLDGDLIYEERAIKMLLADSGDNGTIISTGNYKDDSVFVDVIDNKLNKISKDKFSLGNISGELVGISKISYTFFKEMLVESKKYSNPLLFYEYVLEKVAFKYNVNCVKIDNLLWAEVDNKEQLFEAQIIYNKIKDGE